VDDNKQEMHATYLSARTTNKARGREHYDTDIRQDKYYCTSLTVVHGIANDHRRIIAAIIIVRKMNGDGCISLGIQCNGFHDIVLGTGPQIGTERIRRIEAAHERCRVDAIGTKAVRESNL
jgi:hypothetical protein